MASTADPSKSAAAAAAAAAASASAKSGNGFIGFIKYDGHLTDDGILDARSAAKALHGFDHALRYFVTQQQPDLAAVEFPIPVRIERGSWVALIPHSIGEWIVATMGLAAAAYATTAAKKMAEHDFRDVGLRDAFKKAIHAVQWMIKIGKHLGTLARKSLTGLRWTDGNREVGIPNETGELLYVPREYFELFVECPTGIISDMASVVELERRLIVGLDENGKIEEVTITRRERAIFYADDEDSGEVLFPELAHGQHVELEGLVTRGNEQTNTIGFQYNGHILTCYPTLGSIVRFKPHLFLTCRIIGEVTRLNDDTGESDEARPKIFFDDLVIIREGDPQTELFDGGKTGQ